RINELNKNTWGWAGCSAIQPDQKICLSTGSPPMPAAMTGARGVALKDLNPCPLNVCCNVWGQCGTTEDFCTEAPADTGAPGTSQPGKNGCISNCDMSITNNAVPPASFARVAYFEAWNANRRCLNMDVAKIDTTKFTHIHFAFGSITPDYKIDVSAVQTQFDLMKSMTGIKRIISFGGWAFSTEAPTYNIFRAGVTAENRALLATNVYNFVMEYGLDGVDFDWEYPAAPDLPIIPPGYIQEGLDYLEFLRAVKRRLRTKSVSIAAPASYWYLMGYPMKDIGAVVDYVIYMTYDLHGFLGAGPEGKTSLAAKGLCTDTAGYLANAEIREIIDLAQEPDSGYTAMIYHNHASNSDVLVYDKLEWVSYMTDTTKETRTNWYKSLNFGGVSDWAVDLDRDWGGAGVGSGDDEDTSGLFCDPEIHYDSLEALEAAVDTVTPGCHVIYALDVLQGMLETAVSTYNDFDGNGKNYEGPCPVPDDVTGNWHVGYWDLEMTLRDSDGFDAALADLGIDWEWVEFGEHGYPKMKADWEAPNPKEIMDEVMPNLPNLEIVLMTAMCEIGLGTWEGTNSAVVEVLSMPILMMTQAVDGMNKDLILNIITAVLFFVPALGQFSAAAAGLARLARVFAAVGGISGLGMSIVDIVENPESAPLAIAGMMLGGRIRIPSEYVAAVGLRRGLSSAVREGMGEVYKKKDQSLTNIVKVCWK
ncbi:glycoside hydrolase superfamily, partial [Chaetomium sp. MPI-CAGE-AT-0009]